MKRLVAFASVVSVVQSPASASGTVFSLTVGNNSYVCADLNQRNPGAISPEGQWVLGYWSGLNVAFDADVGASTTGNGVYGEVKLHCASHPSKSLTDAARDVYLKMKAAKK